jgi:hypothetical protein
MILEKAINHGGHGKHSENTTACISLMYHPMGGVRQTSKPRIFAVSAESAVSPWFELRF